ncbi:glycosyltransferase family 9 protein [bacterium]|nr:glycosyltransferase family 9 protein [bacterium]
MGERERIPEGARVLVVLTGSLGDIARGLVVPSLLKEVRGDLSVSWLVEEKWRSVVALSPVVDHVISYHRRDPWWGMPRLWRELRREAPFYCALDLQRHLKSGAFTYASGAPRRIGFAKGDGKEGNWLFQTDFISPCNMKESKVFHYRAFVEKLLEGEDSGVREQLAGLPERFALDRERAQHAFQERCHALSLPLSPEQRYVVAVLGSSWESKDWTLEGYAQTLRLFLRRNPTHQILLLGDSSQVSVGRSLAEVETSRIRSLAGETSLVELIGALSSAEGAFGPDTGSGHLASAVGTPYVGLFGPTDPRRVAPFGTEALQLSSLVPCRPCARRRCPGLDRACMRLISPAAVSEKLSAVISGEDLRQSEYRR